MLLLVAVTGLFALILLLVGFQPHRKFSTGMGRGFNSALMVRGEAKHGAVLIPYDVVESVVVSEMHVNEHNLLARIQPIFVGLVKIFERMTRPLIRKRWGSEAFFQQWPVQREYIGVKEFPTRKSFPCYFKISVNVFWKNLPFAYGDDLQSIFGYPAYLNADNSLLRSYNLLSHQSSLLFILGQRAAHYFHLISSNASIESRGKKSEPCANNQYQLNPQAEFLVGAILSLGVFINLAFGSNDSLWQIAFKTLSIVILLPVCGLLIVHGAYQFLNIGSQSLQCGRSLIMSQYLLN